MRIIYVSPEKLTADRAPALQSLHTIRELSQLHDDVEFVTPWSERWVRRRAYSLTGHQLPERLRITSLGSGPNLPVLARLWPSQVWSGFSHRLKAHLAKRRSAQQSTVIYTRHRRTAACLAKATPVPTMVFEYHEPESIVAAERSEPAACVQRMRSEELTGVQGAAALVTVSHAHADEAPQLYHYERPIHVIPNGVDASVLKLRLDERQVRRGHFLYVGSLEAWKGLPLAVEALDYARQAHLHICGGKRTSTAWQEIESLSQRLQVADRVHMHGHVPHRELRPLLTTAEAGILAIDGSYAIAERYTCPLKLLEYMMAGLPSIATDLPSVRGLVRHEGEALLFEPGEASALASAMTRLMDDPPLAGRLSRTALQTAEQFTWQKRAERVLAVCDRARRESNQPAAASCSQDRPRRSLPAAA